ncbi:MAG: antibiotic biosynthesis monooxygenase [Alphaproteobacteria bacterium]|nr:antibiotic biosynthesis monooxygenase [Alphaproteobacteria bacterium]
MLIVTGSVTARPETIVEMTEISLQHVARSRGEPGCISHDVACDGGDPLRLIFLERWQDAAALKTHFAVPASRTFWNQLQALAADPGEMHIYDATKIRI